MANYEKVLTGVATHPSHVILILSNENDISGPDGHWGPSPYAEEYACASLYRLALFFWLDVVTLCPTLCHAHEQERVVWVAESSSATSPPR